jgi:hypothetical protein
LTNCNKNDDITKNEKYISGYVCTLGRGARAANKQMVMNYGYYNKCESKLATEVARGRVQHILDNVMGMILHYLI